MNFENQNNEAYMLNSLPQGSREEQRKMMMLLDSYGDNRWWLSDDPETLIRNQFEQKYLLIEFNKFKRAIESIIERPIAYNEFETEAFHTKLVIETLEKLNKKKADAEAEAEKE